MPEDEKLAGVIAGDLLQRNSLLHSMIQNVEVLEQEQGVTFLLGHLEVRQKHVQGSLRLDLGICALERVYQDYVKTILPQTSLSSGTCQSAITERILAL